MYFLKYEDVLQKLTNHGILKLFVDHRKEAKNVLPDEEPILKLDSETLSKIGLKVAAENELLLTYQKNELVFYEIDTGNQIGYGMESQIRQGRNLKTGEFVAQKVGDYDSVAYTGWKIAQQKLNQYPYFVKSYAVGQVCVLKGSEQDFKIENIKPAYDTSSAYLIMEQIQNAIQIHGLNLRARFWTGEDVYNFMQKLIDAYEVFFNEGIIGWDDMDVNILIDKDNNPKLCDFNQIVLTERPRDLSDQYDSAVIKLFSVFGYALQLGEVRYLEVPPSEIRVKIQELRAWIHNTGLQQRTFMLSRPLLNQKLKEIIDACEQRKCINYCQLDEHPSVSAPNTRNREEACASLCTEMLAMKAESVIDIEPVMNPEHFQASNRRLLSIQTSAATRNQPWFMGVVHGFSSFKAYVSRGFAWNTSEVAQKQTFKTETPSQAIAKKFQPKHDAPQCDDRDAPVRINQGFKMPSLSWDDCLSIAPYILHYARKYSPFTLPWNRVEDLSDYQFKFLKEQQILLQKTENIRKNQKTFQAERLVIFPDKSKFIDHQLQIIKADIELFLKNKQASTTQLRGIPDRLALVNKRIQELSEFNKKFKKSLKMFEIRAKRKTRKNPGNQVVYKIIHDHSSGTLKQRFISIGRPESMTLCNPSKSEPFSKPLLFSVPENSTHQLQTPLRIPSLHVNMTIAHYLNA